MAHQDIVVLLEGNVEGVMDRPPEGDDRLESERQKWDAWYDQRNLSRTEAKRRYITVLIGIMREYASSTPEAGELISELEFVWDQVRDNTDPHHSRLRTRGRQPANNQQPRKIAGGNAIKNNSNNKKNDDVIAGPSADTRAAANQGQDDSRLRVLSPHSQKEPDSYTKEEDEDDGEEGEDTFEEARDSFYDDDEDYEYGNHNSYYNDPIAGSQSLRMEDQNAPDKVDSNMVRVSTYGLPQKPSGASQNDLPNPTNPAHQPEGHLTKPGQPDRRWRRDVGHALNQITTELAAIREQLEAQTRADHHSRWRWRPKNFWSVPRYVAHYASQGR
ncbi:hypothetical protein KEM56_004723 [Ascosphaera pollenicola]|nr:hypothetical protein KEM56_004723 [Ascosphaera pollenicola]